jgi:transketolase
MASRELDNLCINTLRFLAVDMVEKANSGHPGLPLDAAPMAYVLWTRFLRFNPRDPHWINRDRFILSAGHGSALLYALLHVTGYDVSMDQLKQFRQWGSITPGHPESLLTPGVEVTTGPLGQGLGNAVGMAIAEANLAARYNKPGHQIMDHFTYGIASDGDLMEGVGSEAASLAGHLKLGKLIVLYDANHVSLAAGTNMDFTEDVAKRFDAYGWQTQTVNDGNDLDAIERAIREARAETERPSLIVVDTILGYGAPNKQGTFEAHGSPLGPEETKLTKQNLGWPLEPTFYLPDEAVAFFGRAVERGQAEQAEWNERFAAYTELFPEQADELAHMFRDELPDGWDADIPTFSPDEKMATRVASQQVLNAIAPKLPALIGGSADLDPSTHTALKGFGDFQNPARASGDTQGSAGGGWSYAGRNLHFGVREHGMGAILNGMEAHGGTIPYGGTFLIFSDYMRPPMRLAALAELGVIYVFTHDSIGLGEDGPTHEPVEQLLGLRSIPNFVVIRPADANETASAWQIAVEHREGPVALVLTRQKLPVLDLKKYPAVKFGVRAGAYVLGDVESGRGPDVILVASGSEVHLALAAREQLSKESVKARVVSMPSWHLFRQQLPEYWEEVFPPGVPLVSIEAGTTLGWNPYVGPQIAAIGVDRFGSSAPGETVMEQYGFNVENVVQLAHAVVERSETH